MSDPAIIEVVVRYEDGSQAAFACPRDSYSAIALISGNAALISGKGPIAGKDLTMETDSRTPGNQEPGDHISGCSPMARISQDPTVLEFLQAAAKSASVSQSEMAQRITPALTAIANRSGWDGLIHGIVSALAAKATSINYVRKAAESWNVEHDAGKRRYNIEETE